jgi:hypothetical protein
MWGPEEDFFEMSLIGGGSLTISMQQTQQAQFCHPKRNTPNSSP